MTGRLVPAESLRGDMSVQELAEAVGLSAETIRRALRDADVLRDSPCYRRAHRGRGAYIIDGREFVRDAIALQLWPLEIAE